MDYTGGEIDLEGVCFGEIDLQKALQPLLERMATDTLRVMLHQNPPHLSYNLDGDTAKIEVSTDAFSYGESLRFTEDLEFAVRNQIDLIAWGGIEDETGWIDDEDKPEIIKMRDDLQKNLNFVNMWLERKKQ
jgi:hypothetical protein